VLPTSFVLRGCLYYFFILLFLTYSDLFLALGVESSKWQRHHIRPLNTAPDVIDGALLELMTDVLPFLRIDEENTALGGRRVYGGDLCLERRKY